MTERKDARTWKQHLENQDTAWRNAIPHIVDAYLQWRYGSPAPVDPNVVPATTEIDVINIYSTATSAHIPRSDKSLTEDVVSAGYLGTSPLFPSLAISFKALELFGCLKLFRPSFSTEAFTELLCYLYYVCPPSRIHVHLPLTADQVPYRWHYRTAIADVFDIYLIIIRDVRQQIMNVLGHGTPDWRAQNACPACSYQVRISSLCYTWFALMMTQLEGEDTLIFDRLVSMDGNNSLKHVARSGGRKVADICEFEDHNYFLSHAFVDSFAHEVKAHQQLWKPELRTDERKSDARTDHESDDGYPDNNEGDPTDGAPINGSCASHWKAAANSTPQLHRRGVLQDRLAILCQCFPRILTLL